MKPNRITPKATDLLAHREDPDGYCWSCDGKRWYRTADEAIRRAPR